MIREALNHLKDFDVLNGQVIIHCNMAESKSEIYG